MKAEIEEFSAKNPNPVLSVAKDGTVLYSNKAGELLLKEWGMELGGKLPSDIKELVQGVIFRNSPEKIEVKAGDRLFLVVFSPLPEQNCVNISGFDINSQKVLEEKLQESERRYHLLFENMLDGFAYCKLLYDEYGHPVDFIYLDTNRAFEQLTSLKNVNGKRATEVIPGIEESHPELLETYSQVAFTGKPEKFEIEFKPLGIWLLISVYSTEREHFVAVFDNITERKKAEEEIKKAFDILEERVKERTVELQKAYNSLKESEESLTEAQKIAHIGSWDNDLVIGKLLWSEEMYHIFGLNPQEPMTYDKFLSCVHPDDRDYVYNSTEEAFNGNVYMTEYRIVRPNGEERIVQSEREVFFDENNKPIRMRGTIQDITERKKNEADLAKMEKIRIKEIHHRIKNNLQVISSLLDLQIGRFSHLDICKVPDVIEAFKESQNRVVSMALIHEELYKGGDIETLNFSEYIKDLADNLLLTYRLGNINISLSVNIDDDIFFDMDTAVPLGIIVNELVSNALKHAFPERNEGEIIIILHREESKIEDNKSTLYTLSVSDNGVGIPKYLETDDIVDTLGMQLVNSLADQLDGELELKRDNGTEFIIKFSVTEETNQTHLK